MNPSTKLQNDRFGWALVGLAAMMWGSDVLLRPKVLAAGFDSVSIVLLEHAALALIFVPTLIRGKKLVLPTGKEFLGLFFIAAAGSTLGTVLLTQAYQVGDPLTATLLQKLQPGFAVVSASMLLKERQRPYFWLWFAMALLGAYFISFGFTGPTNPMTQKGMLAAVYAVSAAGLWGICTAVGRWTLASLEPLPVAGYRFILALPILIAWSLIGGHSVHPDQLIHSSALAPFALIVLLPDTLGMGLYYLGLRSTTASLATLAELAYPVTAMILALGSAEKFSPGQWAGIGVLFISLYLIRRENLVIPRQNPRGEAQG